MELKLNDAALREVLKRSPGVRARLERIASAGAAYARSIAPVGDPVDDTHSGAYRDGIVGDVHVGPSRMVARIRATDPKSWWIEYGAAHMPKYRVLGRTMDHLESNTGE